MEGSEVEGSEVERELREASDVEETLRGLRHLLFTN